MKTIVIKSKLSKSQIEDKFVLKFNYRRFENIEFVQSGSAYMLRQRRPLNPYTNERVLDIFDPFGIEVSIVEKNKYRKLILRYNHHLISNYLIITTLPILWFVGILLFLKFNWAIILVYSIVTGFVTTFLLLRAHHTKKLQSKVLNRIKEEFSPLKNMKLTYFQPEQILMN